MFWNQILIQFYFLVFFQQCILLGLQQRVSKLTQIKTTTLSVKKSTDIKLSPLRIFSRKVGGGGSKNVADVKDYLFLRLRMLR